MIHYVELHNWRSHTKTRVIFEPGTNVIIGINGAGKSSVLEAIYFALFGPPERKNFYSRVLRSGEKEGYVELSFSHGGKTYTVKRWFNAKQQTDARIEGDEKVITSRPRDVDRKIVEVLGMDGKTFRDAVYARQNEMASILQDSRRRKELIDEMLEISEFSTVRDTLTALKNYVATRIREAEASGIRDRIRQMEQLVSSRRQKIKELESEMADIKKQLDAVEGMLSNLRDRLAEEKKRYEELQETKAKIQQIMGRLEILKGRIRQIKEAYGEPTGREDAEIQRLEKELGELEELARRRADLEARIRQIDSLISERKKIIESAQGDVSDVEAKLKEVEEDLRRKRDEESRVRQEMAALAAEERALNKRVSELRSRLKQAEDVERKISEIRERYGNVKDRLEAWKERMQKLRAELEGAKIELRREEEFIESLRGADRCPVCGSSLGRERVDLLIREHEEKKNALQKKIEELMEELKKGEMEIRQLERINEELLRLAAQKDSVQDLNRELKDAEKRLKQIRQRAAELKNEAEKRRKQVVKLERTVEALRKKVVELQRAETARNELQRLETERQAQREALEEVMEKIGERDPNVIRKMLEGLKRRLEAGKMQEEVVKLEEALSNLREREKRLESSEKRVQELSRTVAEKGAERDGLRRTLERISKDLEETRRELEELEDALKKAKEYAESVERRRKVLEVLNRMIPAVETARERVREARLRAINKALNIVWRGIYPRRDITEIRLRPEGNDYVLEVKRSGKWISVDNLSGGEFYDAALALRIAISALKARDLGLLILDEPTHNLDTDATEALAALLNKLPEYGLFRQIIVITHDETLQKAATGTVHLFTRDKDHDKPTKVAKLEITH